MMDHFGLLQIPFTSQFYYSLYWFLFFAHRWQLSDIYYFKNAPIYDEFSNISFQLYYDILHTLLYFNMQKKKAKLKWLKLWSGKFWNPPFPEHVTNSFDTLIYKTRDRQTHNLLRTNRDMFIATRRVSRINHRQETADHKSSS